MKTELLGALVKVTKGKKYVESSDSNLRYIQIEDLRSNNNLKYCKRGPSQVLCEPNDILIAWDGANAGTIGFGLKGAIGSTIAKLHIIKSEIDTNYLGKFLQSKFIYLRERCTGATIPHISKQVLCSIKVPLPPFAEQQRIAKILDAADSLRKKTQQIIDSYDELAQSIFLDMFGDPMKNEKGWTVNSLKTVLTKIGSGATPKGGKESYQTEGISLIRSLNVFDNHFKRKDLAYITESQAKKLNNVIVNEADVLFNITGASVCRCCIVPKKILPARVNQHVAILRPKSERINSIFLNHLLISQNVKKQLLGISKQGGATREAITKEQLENYEIPVPPLNIQNQFAEKIGLIDKQKKLAKQSLQESEDLFNSLLQKAFKGELNN